MRLLCTLILLLGLSAKAQITISNATLSGVTSGSALLSANQTFTGSNIFTQPINGSITGNAATATTATNLVGLNIPTTQMSSNIVATHTPSTNFYAGSITSEYNTPGQGNLFLGMGGQRSLSGAPGVIDPESSTTNSANTFIGWYAGVSNRVGNFNTFIGTGAGAYNDNGDQNTFVGVNSGLNNIDGIHNTFIGAAGKGATNSMYVTAIGIDSYLTGTTTTNSVYIGNSSGSKISYANGNIFIGVNAAYGVTNGNFNVLIGTDTGTGSGYMLGNVGLGYSSLYGATGGSNSYNSALGYKAGFGISNGWYNVFAGFKSGQNILNGNDNITIGDSAGWAIVNGKSNIVVGAGADVTGDASNCLNIGGAIFGTNIYSSTNTPGSGMIGINKWPTLGPLDVNGAVVANTFTTATNLSTQTIDMTRWEMSFGTNAAFAINGFSGLSTTTYQHKMLHVYFTGFGQSSGVLITWPANTHVQGASYLTNQTDIQIDYDPSVPITNVLCLPRW